MIRAAYVHIPFCAHKCHFCDFVVVSGGGSLHQDYCQTVSREIKERLKLAPGLAPLTSVYYGGGTPGYLKPEDLAVIHKTIQAVVGFTPGAEITLETTPASVTQQKAKAWLDLGINRLSVGVESIHDHELDAMGRKETSAQSFKAIDVAGSAGFKNISVDLMYGLPRQTKRSWVQTLKTILSLPVEHVSAYGLALAENSPLYSRLPPSDDCYPDEKTFAQMYMAVVKAAQSAGFKQYEISNFARPGFESKHNLEYWRNREYFAFGVGAHRYVLGVRSANYRLLSKYMKNCLGHEFEEVIDQKTRCREAIMLGLRLRSGINLALFEQEYGLRLTGLYDNKVKEMVSAGLLEQDHGFLRLTDKGVLVSNRVIAELLP